MKYSDIQIIDNQTDSAADNRKKKILIIIMTFLMSYAGMAAYMSTWGEYVMYRYYMLIAVIIGAASAIVSDMFKRAVPFIRYIIIIPVLCSCVPAGVTGILNGARIWIDVIIYNWNQFHDGGIALVSYTGGRRDIFAFSLLICVLTGIIVYYLVQANVSVLVSVYILFWIILQLISGYSDVTACGILLASGLIMAIMGRNFYITGRSIILSVIILFVCLLSTLLGMNQLNQVITFRNNIVEGFDNVRYGKDNLPEGNVRNADSLMSDTQDILTIWSEQDKDIYLNGYVGARYDKAQSRWITLADSAYGGDNNGMFKWLYDNGLDPLKQTSQYYELCDSNIRPQLNNIRVDVNNATRRYVYVPFSVETFVKGKIKENKDINYVGKGLSGISQYEITELSSTRPAELLLAQDWLNNPVTDEQKRYVQAESVYRDFVYENYTAESSDYYELMNEWFWNDYETDSDGIYEAVSRVREVLKDRLVYSESTVNVQDDIQDALMWYMNTISRGNSVVYASVAVQALRAHGIPSRYVEGYYISSDDLRKSGRESYTVTGKNSHAWVEVYFDGIGWQPVDVTPGYYKEAAVLRQMVNMPDDMHRTASFGEESENDTGKITESQEMAGPDIHDRAHSVINTARMASGVVAIIIIILTIVLSVLEVTYYCVSLHQRKIYDRSSPKDKAKIIEKRMYQLLGIKGIDATLGWHTKQIDDTISESIANIEPGDYTRVSAILEKFKYGGCEPENYELRTLEIFANEIFNDTTNEKGLTGFKVRHISFLRC